MTFKNTEEFLAYLENPHPDFDFDLWAQESKNWGWLQVIITGFIVHSAGGTCPFQADGLIHGAPWYYRDRHGVATLNVGIIDGDRPYGYPDVYYTASVDTIEFNDGASFVSNMIELVPNLTRAPGLYEFPCYPLALNKETREWYRDSDSKVDTYPGWGHSPEEAFASLTVIRDYGPDSKITTDLQILWNELRDFGTLPMNTDERTFPDIDPDFRVIPFKTIQ